MRTIRHLLPDFGSQDPDTRLLPAGQVASVAATGEEYESGYKAGWDDAVAAQEKARTTIGGELARSLQDLSFTYREAHTAMVRQVEPLFVEVTTRVLPELAASSLAPMVAEQLSGLAGRMAEVEVLLDAHRDDVLRIESLLDRDFGFPVRVCASEDLAQGQIVLRFGKHEQEIDLPEALTRITAAVDGYFKELKREEIDE